MANTSGAILRQRLSENTGDFISLVTTEDGDSAARTVVSSAFLDLDGGDDDDIFEGWYLLIADSNSSADGENKRIVKYIPDPDSPTNRVASAYSAQIVSGITIELHRYNPVDKRKVINQAIQELYPDLYLPVRDETIIIDNRLSNTGFETFSAGFTGWTEVGSPAVTQETTIVRHGSSSAKIVSGVSIGQLTQAPTINIDEVTNQSARAKRWVYATEPNTARLRLDWDGSSFANSSFHSGRDQWELLEVEAAVPTTATQVKMICEVAASGTGYFDKGWLSLGPVFEYTMPSSIVGDISSINQQRNEDILDGPYYPILDGGIPFEGMTLRVIGAGVLSTPETDSETTEVGEPQVRLIVAYAEMLLWQLLSRPARSGALYREGFLQAAKEAADKVAVLKAQKGMVMPKMSAQRHRLSWHVDSTSTGRTIVFDQPRV